MAIGMSGTWTRATGWYNQRPIRERALMLVTFLVLVLAVGWELLVAPAQYRHQTLQNSLRVLSAERADLLAQQQRLEAELALDPSQALRAHLNARQQRLDSLNQEISEATGELIAPRAMVTLLRDMLAAQDALELQALELQAPTPVYAPGAEAVGAEQAARSEPAKPLLYAHEVELRIRGSYLEVLNYLERLENLDERLGWVRLEYAAGDWPSGVAVIRVQTLSLEPAWLGV